MTPFTLCFFDLFCHTRDPLVYCHVVYWVAELVESTVVCRRHHVHVISYAIPHRIPHSISTSSVCYTQHIRWGIVCRLYMYDMSHGISYIMMTNKFITECRTAYVYGVIYHIYFIYDTLCRMAYAQYTAWYEHNPRCFMTYRFHTHIIYYVMRIPYLIWWIR